MKKSNKLFIIFLSTVLFGFSACSNDKQDKTTEETSTLQQVDPQLVFENDYAELVKVSLAPGEALASHQGEARVIYSLSDYSIEWEEKGQNLGTKSWKKGAVHFHEAGQHAAQNNGNTKAEWLAFVKKTKELPDCSDYSIENDVNAVADDYATQLFDNEYFRISEISLPQGEKIPMHSGINRLIYSLSDYQILYESDKEGKVEKTFRTGDVHWHEACQHALENTGSGVAKFLVVTYKK